MGDSGDFIFTKREDGSLEFKGDFEGLYQADPDPWGQSGEHPRMKEYYDFSRTNLVAALREFPWSSALEVGCGAGHVVRLLDSHFPRHRIVGLDISPTAVGRARKLLPGHRFCVADFGSPVEHMVWQPFDVVILNQMLWYVLYKLPSVFENVLGKLRSGGRVIISNGFLGEQRYGKDVVDGFNGLLKYVLDHHFDDFHVTRAQYDPSIAHYIHHDGLLVLQSKR